MAKKKNKKKPQQQVHMSPERFMREKVRTLPIGKCYITPGWQENGLAHVIVTRTRPSGNVVVGAFLVDTYCLGVKDAMYIVNMDEYDFQDYLNRFDTGPGIKETSYNEAHNLIYGAIGFAQDGGIAPAKEFRIAGYVLEEDTDDVPLIEYDYGKNGKHLLVVSPDRKEMKYVNILKKHLGDDFDYVMPSGEYNDEWDDDSESFEEEEYSYKYPEYPAVLEVKNQFIVPELYDPKNYEVLPDEVINRILALPHDEAAEDISKIILFEIGRTYRQINDGTIGDPESGTIMHALLLLGQLKSSKGQDAVLEIMRQTEKFAEYHLGDLAPEQIPVALYACSQDSLEPVIKYLYEPGLNSYLRGMASEVLSMTVFRHPERRTEIIDIYRDLLKSMVKRLPDKVGCDGFFAGGVMNDLLNIRATELLSEIKAVFDTGCVDEMMVGDFNDVRTELGKTKQPDMPWYYESPDIHKQYERVRKLAEDYKKYADRK